MRTGAFPAVATLRFGALELEAFVHATESREKVEQALWAVAPGARVESRSLSGHFGQRLLVLRARQRDAKAIERAITRIRESVGPEIARSADRRVDEQGRVFARLDKQAAAEGKIALAGDPEHDVIKLVVRIRFPPRRRADLLEALRAQFGDPSERGKEGEEE